jgi:hypothetical protein
VTGARPGQKNDTEVAEPQLDVSVIVPVVERPESLVELYEEFSKPLVAMGVRFEFLFVAHPWFDALTKPLSRLAATGAPVRLLEAGYSVGETKLLLMGAAACRGRIVVTLPAYRQVEAAVLPALVRRVEQGADLAVAWRFPRVDAPINRLQNRLLHRIIGSLSEDRIHDVACGVRAMRAEFLRELPLYGDFARFLPLLAHRDGYVVEQVKTPVHARAMAARVYSPGTYLRRIIDVVGLIFLLRFTDKPLRLFGLVGSVTSMVGAAILALIFVQRLAGQGAADRPLLLLGVLLLTLGVQAIALGLIGEMIVHLNAPRRRVYRLRASEGEPRDPGAS